jgi:hypothetical protein
VALAIDASTPAKTTGTTLALTTASFTPPSGSLVLINFGSNNIGTTDVSIASVTNTGTAITWSRWARKNKNAGSDGGAGQEGGAEIWAGEGTGGAITITVTGVGTGVGAEKMVDVIVFTGAVLTVGNKGNGSNNAGTVTCNVTGCSAGSHVVASASDWSQAGLGTAGSGQTIVNEHDVAGQISLHTWRTTSVLGSAGTQTMNLTAPATQDFNLVAVEVVDSGGAPPGDPGYGYLLQPDGTSRLLFPGTSDKLLLSTNEAPPGGGAVRVPVNVRNWAALRRASTY